jgi:hypothetical protein
LVEMRGRFWVAAVAAASPILLFGAAIGTRGFAQETATAEDAADPNAGGATPAEQTAKPDAMPAPADPAAEAAAPADNASEPAATPPATTTVQTVAIPAAATPIVEAIRAKLADPVLRGKANPDDIAALEVFYNGRSEPVWMTDMGFSREGLAAIDEILEADDWGLSSSAFALPSAGKLPASIDDEARFEIELDLAVLQYARYARGGRTDPDKLKNNDMVPTFAIRRPCLPGSPMRPSPISISSRCIRSTSHSSACARRCSRRAPKARRAPSRATCRRS